MNTLSRSIVAILICSAPVLAGADGDCHASPAGSGGSAGSAGSPGCAAQDAEAEGACLLTVGYKWDGARCVSLGGCRCVGADCAELFGSAEACASAHTQCDPVPKCSSEVAAVRDFVNANKACKTSYDCQISSAGCGYTEDGCTGAVYVNRATNLTVLRELASQLYRCNDGSDSCAVCERMTAPAACVSGACRRATR